MQRNYKAIHDSLPCQENILNNLAFDEVHWFAIEKMMKKEPKLY